MELTSSYTIGPAQVDGRFYVSERHETADGRIIEREWLSDGTISPDVMLEEHALAIKAKLAERAAAQTFAAGVEVPLTKYEFKERFTAEERKKIRQRSLVDEDAKDIEDMLNSSGMVYLSKARGPLQYYVAVGDLTAERAAVIGAD